MTIVNPLDIDAITLDSGSHRSSRTPADGACILEAASWIAGEPWSDHPQCVSPVIGAFCRSWNDTLDRGTRNRLLKPFVTKIIGTATGDADERVREYMACDWLVRTFTPAWLRRAGLNDDAAALEALPELSSEELARAAMPTITGARQRAAAAWAAAWAAAGDAAWAAAGDAAFAAAGAAAWAAAGAAAWAAAWAAARDAAGAAAGAAAGDAAWAAAGDAAWAAARDAAGDALAETVTALQASAVELLDRMCEVGR